MGFNILASVEKRTPSGWVEVNGLRFKQIVDPGRVPRWGRWNFLLPRMSVNNLFWFRCYMLYELLTTDFAGYGVPSLSKPRGIPLDSPRYYEGEHGAGDENYPSWLSLEELLNVDYNRKFFGDGQFRGQALCLREVINPQYFKDLEVLRRVGAPSDVRVVFAFV